MDASKSACPNERRPKGPKSKGSKGEEEKSGRKEKRSSSDGKDKEKKHGKETHLKRMEKPDEKSKKQTQNVDSDKIKQEENNRRREDAKASRDPRNVSAIERSTKPAISGQVERRERTDKQQKDREAKKEEKLSKGAKIVSRTADRKEVNRKVVQTAKDSIKVERTTRKLEENVNESRATKSKSSKMPEKNEKSVEQRKCQQMTTNKETMPKTDETGKHGKMSKKTGEETSTSANRKQTQKETKPKLLLGPLAVIKTKRISMAIPPFEPSKDPAATFKMFTFNKKPSQEEKSKKIPQREMVSHRAKVHQAEKASSSPLKGSPGKKLSSFSLKGSPGKKFSSISMKEHPDLKLSSSSSMKEHPHDKVPHTQKVRKDEKVSHRPKVPQIGNISQPPKVHKDDNSISEKEKVPQAEKSSKSEKLMVQMKNTSPFDGRRDSGKAQKEQRSPQAGKVVPSKDSVCPEVQMPQPEGVPRDDRAIQSGMSYQSGKVIQIENFIRIERLTPEQVPQITQIGKLSQIEAVPQVEQISPVAQVETLNQIEDVPQSELIIHSGMVPQAESILPSGKLALVELFDFDAAQIESRPGQEEERASQIVVPLSETEKAGHEGKLGQDERSLGQQISVEEEKATESRSAQVVENVQDTSNWPQEPSQVMKSADSSHNETNPQIEKFSPSNSLKSPEVDRSSKGALITRGERSPPEDASGPEDKSFLETECGGFSSGRVVQDFGQSGKTTEGSLVQGEDEKKKLKRNGSFERDYDDESFVIIGMRGQPREKPIVQRPDIEKYRPILETKVKSFKEKLKAPYVESAELGDFTVSAFLAEGGFGKVLLATHNATNVKYALKVQTKKHLMALQGRIQRSLSEKRILSSIDFAFIVRMFYCFKDNSHVYFALEHVEAGDFCQLTQKQPTLREDAIRLYVGQVLLAIEYLHAADIIHRDLKPQNLLVTRTGYLKLGHLGYARELKTIAYTFCGTPEYIAPEILNERGYGKAVDWWSLGILTYELFFTDTPFSRRTIEGTYETILSKNVHFPRYRLVGTEVKTLITGLLDKHPIDRLGGSIHGAEEIKEHEWFSTLDWIILYEGKYPPPYSVEPLTGKPYDVNSLVQANTPQFEDEFADF